MGHEEEPEFDFEGYDKAHKRDHLVDIGAKVAHVEDALDMQGPEIKEIEEATKQLLQDVKDINARHGFKA